MQISPLVVTETVLGLGALYWLVSEAMGADATMRSTLAGHAPIAPQPSLPYAQFPENTTHRFTKDWVFPHFSFHPVTGSPYESFALAALERNERTPSTYNMEMLLSPVRRTRKMPPTALRAHLLSRNIEENPSIARFYHEVAKRGQ